MVEISRTARSRLSRHSTAPTRTPTPTPTSSPTSSRGSSRECQRVVELVTGITSGNCVSDVSARILARMSVSCRCRRRGIPALLSTASCAVVALQQLAGPRRVTDTGWIPSTKRSIANLVNRDHGGIKYEGTIKSVGYTASYDNTSCHA